MPGHTLDIPTGLFKRRDSSVLFHVARSGIIGRQSQFQVAEPVQHPLQITAPGADILTGSSQMVVGPIATAIDRGDVLWFGTQSNQAKRSEKAGVAFQVYHWEVILTDMITQINAGTLGGASFTLNLANGGLVIEYNDAYTLSGELKTLANDTIQGIIDGKITVLPAE